MLRKEAEKSWRKKQAGELFENKEALAWAKLRREQIDLELVLKRIGFKQEQHKLEEPAVEDSKQEAQEVPKQEARNVPKHEAQEVPEQEAQEVPEQEVLNEVKVSPSKDTGLPQDFKIRSTEISVLEKIGSGAFATVHKCRWQNYDYAVKIFEGGDVDSLRAEVQNLVLLPRHPNIVLLVGFSINKTNGRPMLVMELLDGDLHNLICSDKFKKKHQLTPGSLKETPVSRLWNGCCLGGQPDISTIRAEVGNNSTPIEEAIDFIYQIAKGMLFLHNRKIFHGDLKCKNVLVKQLPDGRFQLKIADFGVSEKLLIKREHFEILDSTIDLNCTCHSNNSGLGVRTGSGNGKAQVQGNIGTLRWMAPEVYGVTDGDMKPYSMKADVYSFAMTCVEILTGEHPFPDRRASKSLREYVKSGGRPDLSTVKDVPNALRELVERCWDADPLLRPDFSVIYSEMESLQKRFPMS